MAGNKDSRLRVFLYEVKNIPFDLCLNMFVCVLKACMDFCTSECWVGFHIRVKVSNPVAEICTVCATECNYDPLVCVIIACIPESSGP